MHSRVGESGVYNSWLTGAEDEVQQLAQDKMQGRVGNGRKAGGRFQAHTLLLLGQN